MITIIALLALTAFFTNIANGACKTFKEVRTRQPFAFTTEHVPGFNDRSQLQQISASETCTKNLQGVDLGGSICHKSTCILRVQGNLHAHTVTNITAATPLEQQANERIIQLALQQYFPHFETIDEFRFATSMATHPQHDVYTCIHPGESSVTYFNPIFICAEGLLSGCDENGAAFEKDNESVAVCAPYTVNDAQALAGFYERHNITAAEAKQLKDNPALKVKIPKAHPSGSGAPLVASSSMFAVFGLVASVFLV